MDVTTNAVTEIVDTKAVCGGNVTGDTGEYIPITDILIRNKFQLYNRNRQKIVADARLANSFLKPMQALKDSKQSDKPFLLMGYSFKPMSDTYTLEMYEYDNTTPVTLNIVETITTG